MFVFGVLRPKRSTCKVLMIWQIQARNRSEIPNGAPLYAQPMFRFHLRNIKKSEQENKTIFDPK